MGERSHSAPWFVVGRSMEAVGRVELHHSFFSPPLGGQERRMHYLAGELLRRGVRVVVCAPVDGVANGRDRSEEGLEICPHPSFFSRKPQSLLDPLLYTRKLEKFHLGRFVEPPGAVLGFHSCYVVAARRAWPGTRIAFLPGASAWDWFTSLYGHRARAVRSLLLVRRVAALFVERLAIRASDRIFVESDFLAQRLYRFHKHSKEKITVLPPCVDSVRFRPCAIRRQEVRTELGIPPEAIVILGVGRLDCNKNFEILIRALRMINRPDVILVVAGAGAQRSYLEDLAETEGVAGAVKLVGFRSDVERLYSAADVYAHPSLLESYSNAVLEAMATGLPCVISSEVSRDLTHEGNALLANPRDVRDWAFQIERLIRDRALAVSLGASARRFALRRHGWAAFVDRLFIDLGCSMLSYHFEYWRRGRG